MAGSKTNSPKEELASSRVSESRVSEMLDVAAEVFFEHGFAAASVGEMARRAKASKGTYYSRYPSKADLFEAIIRRRSDLAFPSFQMLLEKEGPLKKTLQDFARQLVQLTLEPDSISLIRLLYMEARHFPELGKAFYEHGIGRVQNVFCDFLRVQMRRGLFHIQNVPVTAQQFMDGLIGEPTRRLALGIHPPLSRRELDIRIELAIQTFFAAYAAPGEDRISGTH